MVGMSLLFPGACARVVAEDPVATRSGPQLLRRLPRLDGEEATAVPLGAVVQVLYGPRAASTCGGPATWWAVRVLDGPGRDRVGWMFEMMPGTEYYVLREVRCPSEAV